ncbi:hypothetical protein RclHR1_00210028 [Rhizophagus clarus]|uniref:Uncharacterized protein n=1 Tax=Rhizophagus clarus TaxID=94130 RepID=A0A2Z6QWX4_9GLOM|nr:hypothetical protein RclHR1_00210028 [Rhizophagus clarus]
MWQKVVAFTGDQNFAFLVLYVVNLQVHLVDSVNFMLEAFLMDVVIDTNDMKTWKDSIEIPIGIKTDYFIAREAIINVFKPLDTFIYPELEFLWTNGDEWIPIVKAHICINDLTASS